jgi:hypothetical protein
METGWRAGLGGQKSVLWRQGMSEPEEAKIVLVKTNNGWAAR